MVDLVTTICNHGNGVPNHESGAENKIIVVGIVTSVFHACPSIVDGSEAKAGHDEKGILTSDNNVDRAISEFGKRVYTIAIHGLVEVLGLTSSDSAITHKDGICAVRCSELTSFVGDADLVEKGIITSGKGHIGSTDDACTHLGITEGVLMNDSVVVSTGGMETEVPSAVIEINDASFLSTSSLEHLPDGNSAKVTDSVMRLSNAGHENIAVHV